MIKPEDMRLRGLEHRKRIHVREWPSYGDSVLYAGQGTIVPSGTRGWVRNVYDDESGGRAIEVVFPDDVVIVMRAEDVRKP